MEYHVTSSLVAALAGRSDPFGALYPIRYRVVDASVKQLMLSYYVAKKWLDWYNNPNSEGCPLKDKESDYHDQETWMTDYVAAFEARLIESTKNVVSYFEALPPTLLDRARDKDDHSWIVELLRTTAEFFSQHEHPEFMQKIS